MIEVKNLTKVYGDIIAVNNISFNVRKGEIFSLLGPNGAGKTTTVEMLEMIRKPTSGEIKIFDSKTDIKENIGILPQKFQSFERLSVRETLKYFSSLYEKRIDIDELLNLIGLKEVEGIMYKNLSGGLKRRVGVAIALVNDPELIFLDEPTTGLDPAARRSLWEVIKNLKKRGKTIILTTHYMEEAQYLADRVAIMHRGKIIAMDEPHKLIERYGDKTKLIIKGADGNLKEILPSIKYSSSREAVMEIDDEGDIASIILQLKKGGIRYERIEIERANLEDVFLKLTGAKLRG